MTHTYGLNACDLEVSFLWKFETVLVTFVSGEDRVPTSLLSTALPGLSSTLNKHLKNHLDSIVFL